MHLGHLRRQLGVRQSTPNAAVLLEAGERPLWVRWLVRAGRLWNRLTAEPAGSLLRRAFEASLQLAAPAGGQPGRQSWAGQVAAALVAIGMPADLQAPRPLCIKRLQQQAIGRHLAEIRAAAGRPGASKLAYYVSAAWDGRLPPAEEYVPAPAAYVLAVRQRARRTALAQLRTGSHWLAEETGRWERLPREQRMCPNCQEGVEDVEHVLFVCPLYSPLRARFPDLFLQPEPSVHAFLQQDPVLLSAFVADCQSRHAAAAAARAAGEGVT
jgi:hypothetical protein